jgi:hypothetical protein
VYDIDARAVPVTLKKGVAFTPTDNGIYALCGLAVWRRATVPSMRPGINRIERNKCCQSVIDPRAQMSLGLGFLRTTEQRPKFETYDLNSFTQTLLAWTINVRGPFAAAREPARMFLR